jgi:HNH endonuclease
MISLADRFWAKVVKTTTCWLWVGACRDNGYGHLSRGKRGEGNISAHRASWEIYFGPIPDGLDVLHRCDVHNCVRPDHLFLGTQADNTHDMIEKGRAAYGSRHGGAKLDEETVVWLRTHPEIPTQAAARQLAVSERTIRDARNGRYWRAA